MQHLHRIRENIELLWSKAAAECDGENILVLDIAPQVHGGAAKYFTQAAIETLDIDPQYNTTYVGDICCKNESISTDRFDVVICTEVLEHTNRPWDAVVEINRILKPGGILYGSVPFDLAIHDPRPDNYRFTADGLRYLLREYAGFRELEITVLESGRINFPIHYTFKAVK